MRRDVRGVHRRHDRTDIRHGRGKAAVLADDAVNGRADFLRELQGGDEVHADVPPPAPAADGEAQQAVPRSQPAAAAPISEDAGPAPAVGAGDWVGDGVGWRVALEAAKLAE